MEKIREEKNKIARKVKVLEEATSQLNSLKKNLTDLQTRDTMRHEKHKSELKTIRLSTAKVKDDIENFKKKIDQLSMALNNSMCSFLFTIKLIHFNLAENGKYSCNLSFI